MKKQLLTIIVLFAITTLCKVEAQTIKLWGVTYAGGANGAGNIFECNDSGTITDTCDFNTNGIDADDAEGALIKAYNGLLYGMTYKGGSNSNGTIFSYNTLTNKDTTVHSFGSDDDGYNPYNGSLLQGSDSLLYGLTEYGGTHEEGVIFGYDISQNMYYVVHDFGVGNEGIEPAGSLIQATDSLLYGMTYEGGANNEGTIFSYNIVTGKETDKYDFGSGNDGTYPYGSLTQVSDSVLYGMTSKGGANNEGIIFSYNILTGKETDKYDFYSNGLDAAEPYGSLLLAKNGLLYGLTNEGGDDVGTIFSFNMKTNVEDVLHIFGNDEDGSYPYGDLIEASNGLLYGLTEEGGTNEGGTIFNFDIADSTETVLYNFSTASGDEPYGDLLEDDTTINAGVHQLPVTSGQLSVYPNPAGSFFNVAIILNQTLDLQLRLVNIFGQTVWGVDAEEVSSYQNGISVADLAEGVYLLEMVTGGGAETKEVVVTR